MKNSLMVRMIVIGLLACGLAVPIAMIGFLVGERAYRRDQAVGEISGMWSTEQVVSGPILVVPYRCGPPLGPKVTTECHDRFTTQARTLTIESSVEPEVRKRSLFSVVVYRARVKVNAVFAPELGFLNPAPTEVFWESGSVNVGVSDPRGIVRAVELVSGDVRTRFVPGVAPGLGLSGMRAPLPGIRPSVTGEISVSFEFELNGTRELNFSMLGDDAVVRLRSPWAHPSFVGGALPVSRTTNPDGFSAEWRTGAFWRSASPSTQRTSGASVAEAIKAGASAAPSFGVALITPVDVYQQTERAVKYAILFLGATFLTAFLWEVTRGVLVHPVQYAFVGLTMCVFYLLLLSGAEHVGFDPAYLTASAVTTLLLSWYWRWVVGGRAQGGVMAMILFGQYGLLYLLLRLEDYALLAGSIGLFLALAAAMFLTRKVNWYQLGKTSVPDRP